MGKILASLSSRPLPSPSLGLSIAAAKKLP